MRPTGAGLKRLTRTARIDEFAPRNFAGGILFSRGDDSETPAAYADVYTMKRSGKAVQPQVRGARPTSKTSRPTATCCSSAATRVSGRSGWPGPGREADRAAGRLATTSVFSSDGKRVAAIVELEEEQRLVSIDVANGATVQLAAGYDLAEGASEIGPVIDWQPTPSRR